MIKKTKIIGILNITKDSFSDGSLYLAKDNAIKHVRLMIQKGCDIIDIGAESTRPGFDNISPNTQLDRILPIINTIREINQNIKISVDTRSSIVAEQVLLAGASIINDVSSGTYDSKIFDIVSKYKSEIILTHMPYEHLVGDHMKTENILQTIEQYFNKIIKIAEDANIDRKKIIIDPGIGFGKSGKDNILVIKNINYFINTFDRVCLGVSNKRFSSKLFNDIKDEELSIASLAISSIMAYSGIEFLRVHDVETNKDAVEVAWKTANS